MIKLKTAKELDIMREAGKILAAISEEIYTSVEPGITTKELDEKAFALCKKHNVEPAFLGYNDYPYTLCVGVDDIAIHGMPDENEVLLEGDIISVDMGIVYKGFYSDKASTVPVGEIDDEGKRLLATARLALDSSINKAVVGNTIGDIGFVMNQIAELAGFSVITDMVGHGVGRELHEDPSVPCYGEPGEGEPLEEGMVIAIEAMINEGESDLVYEDDGWTTRTKDGKRSVIFEHTVAVGLKTPKILTIQ